MNLLDTHRIKLPVYDPLKGPHLFDLNSDNAGGISITDQMRRGHGIIVEALDAKIIGPDKPLLIIGAGVAGMMAALTAAKDNVTTRVIEKKAGSFSVQANCPSRWVCPTQYSWPDKGWDTGTYPLDEQSMAFVWKQGVADAASEIVRQDTEQIIANLAHLKVIRRTKFMGYRLTPDQHGQLSVIPRLDVTPQDPQFPVAFSMALACTGFGKENTVVETSTGPLTKYTGHIFWQLDRYEDDNPPLGIHSGAPRVLISGSGDGALQDFLRIATKIDANTVSRPTARRTSSAAALYLQIFKTLPSVGRRIDERIQGIEQDYRSKLINRASRSNDTETRDMNKCLAHGEAHVQHLILIQELCKETSVWNRVVDSMDRMVKNLRDEITIKVLYPCFHISPYYGLNRFMTLLLYSYALQKYPDIELLYPGKMVTKVVGSGKHAPPDTCTDAEHCHGKDHRVLCASGNCLSVRSAVIGEGSEFDNGPYNAVIIRHGIVPNSRTNVLSEKRLEQ